MTALPHKYYSEYSKVIQEDGEQTTPGKTKHLKIKELNVDISTEVQLR